MNATKNLECAMNEMTTVAPVWYSFAMRETELLV